MARPRALAHLLALLAVATGVVATLVVVHWHVGDIGQPLIASAATVPALVLGTVVAVKRPGSTIGPLLCLVGLVPLVVLGLGEIVAAAVRLHPGEIAVHPIHAALAEGAWMWLYVPTALLLLLFPDGRLPTPRWAWVPTGLVATPIVFAALALLAPGPFSAPFADVGKVEVLPEPAVTPTAGTLLIVFLLLLVASSAALLVRYRHARGNQLLRSQLRLFVLGAVALPITLLLCWAGYRALGGPNVAGVALIVTTFVIPIAVAFIALRHELLDVDQAVAATVTYVLAAGTLSVGFLLAAIGSGILLGMNSPALAAAITACCALLLAPLRSRVQHRVDRRFNPRRYDVRAALDQLRADVDQGTANPESLQATLRGALNDPRLRVRFRAPGHTTQQRIQPNSDAADIPGVEVKLGDVVVGAIVPGTPTVPRQLLVEAAAGSGLVLELIRNRVQLRDALAEVAASRARLLHAGYAERTRLQRDLHDGAQQRLVSLGITLRLIQRHLSTSNSGHHEAENLIDSSVAELSTAVAELRAISHGLRPACLDSGLAPALRALAAGVPIPVQLDLRPGSVPDVVATTAWFVANEALANVVKHSGASHVIVTVSHIAGSLSIRICDDGCGGARPSPGSGLTGLADRVAAAGGQLSVSDTIGRPGTTLVAVLPCKS